VQVLRSDMWLRQEGREGGRGAGGHLQVAQVVALAVEQGGYACALPLGPALQSRLNPLRDSTAQVALLTVDGNHL
jgi:hypothetical protein